MLPKGLLRWIYLARLTLAGGVFVGALVVWTRPGMAPETTLVTTLVLVMTLGFTAGSFWHTHLARQRPTTNFLFAQVLFDVFLVTAVVHLTGRGESDFAPLYILAITEGALLLPLRGGLLVSALAIAAYFADAVWGGQMAGWAGGAEVGPALTPGVVTRVSIFAVIALATGLLGDRLRRTGSALGAVESELRQLRLDTDDILGALDTGVATFDTDGALAYMNASAEALLGMRAEDWLERPALDEMDRIAPGLGSVVRRSLATGMPVARYETHARAGADVRVLGLRTTPLERDERPWVTVVMQDITDAREAEAARRRAERLEAVAELAASLAHEIKNPLASIRSAVEQLTEPDAVAGRSADSRARPRGEPRLRDEDRSVLGRLVVTESDRLSRLLSGFIEFTRVEARSGGTVDLTAIARHAADVARQHPDAGNGTGIEVDAPSPVEIEGDADLLHRVVLNLVLNALQHSDGRGAVRIEVASIEAGDLPAGVSLAAPSAAPAAPPLAAEGGRARGARLRVSDRGAGIPPDDVARIFDPFFTTRPGGSGLGLAMVQRAVEAHQGTILVDSERGRGTTFTLYLPARGRQAAP